MNTTLTLGALVVAGIVVACGGTDGSSSVPEAPKVPAAPLEGVKNPPPESSGQATGGAATGDAGAATPKADDPGEDGEAGEDGQAGRIAVNQHCCYGGKYFSCPNETACFGGVDVDACLATCGAKLDCFDKCFEQLDNAPAPKGCRSDVKPPPGVDCANGQINL